MCKLFSVYSINLGPRSTLYGLRVSATQLGGGPYLLITVPLQLDEKAL